MTVTKENLDWWTAERRQQLAALWSEGHATAEIARRMGISKIAVIGKAHRIGLKPRENPIRNPRPRPQLPASPSCVWPIGEPGKPGFRFCGKRLPADTRRVYCDEHAAGATMKRQPATARA